MARIITPTFYPHGIAPGARLVLVACAGAKLTEAAQAGDLYLPSDLFNKSRAYAERLIATGQADAWFILSAKHGIVSPSAVIAPYDVSLTTMRAHERVQWGIDVIDQLHALAPSAIVALAGQLYRKPLAAYASAHRLPLEVPMQGLGIGDQKAWLKGQVAV